MKLSIEIQKAGTEKQKAFAKLFTFTKHALEKDFKPIFLVDIFREELR